MALYRGSCKLAGLGRVPGTTYVTETEYNCLPSSKLTDGVNYGIYEDGTDNTITKFIQNGCEYCLGGGGPSIGTVDMLVVGGGGTGGRRFYDCWYVGGGGAGGAIEQVSYPVSAGEYCITVGCGGAGDTAGNEGGDSCALGIIAHGGGRGAGGSSRYCPGYNGGSGGGGGACDTSIVGYGCGTQGEGYNGAAGDCYMGGGGGGAGGPGNGCLGGPGICSCISGRLECYAFGGNGTGASDYTECNYCGSGSHPAGSGNNTIPGKGGIVIIRYPNNGKVVATGGCRYECDGYMIHCYPSSGTFTVY